MKKNFLLIFIVFTLVGCGNKTKTYTKHDKEVVIESILNGDKKAIKTYKYIVSRLERKSKKGNQVAKKEFLEWMDMSAYVRMTKPGLID